MLKFMLKARAKQLKKNQKGFTLVELIVVVAILGILAAIGIARFGGMTDKARLNSDYATAATIASAAQAQIATLDKKATADDVTVAKLKTAELLEKIEYKSQTNGGDMEVTYDPGTNQLTVGTEDQVFYPKQEIAK